VTKNIVFLFILGLFIGCGNGSNGNKQIQNTTSDKVASKSIDKPEKMVIAKDNLLNDVIKEFNGYKVRVKTDTKIDENSVSNDTIILEGEINGKNTKALLKLNSNYPKGTKVIVEALNKGGTKIIASSKVKTIAGYKIYFGSIDTTKKGK